MDAWDTFWLIAIWVARTVTVTMVVLFVALVLGGVIALGTKDEDEADQ